MNLYLFNLTNKTYNKEGYSTNIVSRGFLIANNIEPSTTVNVSLLRLKH